MSSPLNVCLSSLSTIVSKDGAVLFDLEHDRLLKLNQVGAEMWQLLSAGETESQIVDSIAQRYGVDKQSVAADFRALRCRFTKLGLVPAGSKLAWSGQGNSPHSALAEENLGIARAAGDSRPEPSVLTVFVAVLFLFLFDLILRVSSLKSLCRAVHAWPLKRSHSEPRSSLIDQVCGAVEHGCVWYPKKALCLQRSAVTACLLRSRGVAARLVIGARPMPFLAHAWVEVEGSVVNDVSTVKNFYQPLASY